jgi:hypothetical protein
MMIQHSSVSVVFFLVGMLMFQGVQSRIGDRIGDLGEGAEDPLCKTGGVLAAAAAPAMQASISALIVGVENDLPFPIDIVYTWFRVDSINKPIFKGCTATVGGALTVNGLVLPDLTGSGTFTGTWDYKALVGAGHEVCIRGLAVTALDIGGLPGDIDNIIRDVINGVFPDDLCVPIKL